MHMPQEKTLSIPNDIKLKLKKIADIFDDKYIEYTSGSDENLTIRKYLENIRPYLQDMIDTLKTSAEWKTHLTMKINFMSLTSSVEYHQIPNLQRITQIS